MIGKTLEQHTFRAGDFEGPLDLLLFLIKKSEVSIYDIPIAEITEQYLSYLSYAVRIDLENATEFYRMASTLLYIKSRTLLPVELDYGEEYEDPRQELVERLIEHQKYKKIGVLMSQQEREAEWIAERSDEERILPFSDDHTWEQVSAWDLLKAFSTVVSTISYERVIDLYEEVTVNEKITLMHEVLEMKASCKFTDLIVKGNSVMEVVCAFFAVLEMVKSKQILVFQSKPRGQIMISTEEIGREHGC